MTKLPHSLYSTVRYLIVASIVLYVSDLAAQTPPFIRGKVLDKETNAPLTFASVRIIGGPIGTVTNSDGEFDFYISEKHTEDTLMISMMGYHPSKIIVKDIDLSEKLMVRLTVKPIQLNEVVITDTKLTAKEIFIKAIESVENNFQIEPYTLRGFYRETQQENSNSKMLIEAALDIFDTGYKPVQGNRSQVREKVILKNSRASKNYRHDVFKNTVIEKFNLVSSALRCNPVKYRNRHTHKEAAGKTFSLDSVIYLNDKPVYVISFFSYIRRYPLFERKNTIYIDAANYAVYKYGWEEYAKKGKYSEKPWRFTKDSTYLSCRKRISTTYEYTSYKGKMFLRYFDERCYDDIYNSKGDSVEFEQLSHVTLVVTDIATESISADAKATIKLDQSLISQVGDYDPQFWRNSQQIKLVPLTKKQIKDLEWEMPLAEQFVKSKGVQKTSQ